MIANHVPVWEGVLTLVLAIGLYAFLVFRLFGRRQ